MRFMGFKRSDGSVGIRNKVLILPTVVCSSETARLISMQVEGTTTFNMQQGCGQIGRDAERTMNILVGLGKNPNVFGVVVVGLGCETAQPHIIADRIRESGKPVEVVVIQEEGGTAKAAAKGVEYARCMVEDMSEEVRTECDVSELIVAVECGGSDPTSGLAANPALGYASDPIIKEGGTIILSETTEFIGAEHILMRRAKDKAVADRIYEIVKNIEDEVKSTGADLRGANPSPGNIAGGLSTIEEKSLGCIHKGGTTPVMEVVEYGKKPTEKGLVIMDSPGFDVDSVVGMVAGGAQVCVFTTGRGTPVGNSIVPVIKVTGNPMTYRKMEDNIDINAGTILEGKNTLEDVGREIFNEILSVSNGRMTKAESFGFSEFGIWRCGITI
ncbi:MAG: UxaA family hydrolase [Thermoanaerobacteraceae bacterium]|nr:UxaA family hydrolase [Thermoanaerobacteraceae bacterium]